MEKHPSYRSQVILGSYDASITLDDMKNSTVDPKVTKVPDENKNTKNSSVNTIENTSSKTITQKKIYLKILFFKINDKY